MTNEQEIALLVTLEQINEALWELSRCVQHGERQTYFRVKSV